MIIRTIVAEKYLTTLIAKDINVGRTKEARSITVWCYTPTKVDRPRPKRESRTVLQYQFWIVLSLSVHHKLYIHGVNKYKYDKTKESQTAL